MYGNNLIVLVALALVAGCVITTWIRAKYGYPLNNGAGVPVHRGEASPHKDVLGAMEAALAERDTRIAQLEERVRVLERIVTDRKAALREELDGLRA